MARREVDFARFKKKARHSLREHEDHIAIANLRHGLDHASERRINHSNSVVWQISEQLHRVDLNQGREF